MLQLAPQVSQLHWVILQQLSPLHYISYFILIVITVVGVIIAIVPREVAAIVVIVRLKSFVVELSVVVAAMMQIVMAASSVVGQPLDMLSRIRIMKETDYLILFYTKLAEKEEHSWNKDIFHRF